MICGMQDGNRVNYQRLLDRTLSEIAGDGRIPSLLLHACLSLIHI